MSKPVYCGLLAAALVLGLAFRLARLDARPMHHDEANQAVKFGVLLETGEYRYDKADHHGPSLYYLTLPAAWLRGQHSLAALDETTVRAVPVVFGTALILLFALLAPGLGRPAAAAGALLAAVSPVLTYYSRFYIQESLFAFCALAFVIALGTHARRPRLSSALASGLLAGLAMATKETWMIVLPAAVIACIAAHLTSVLPPGSTGLKAGARGGSEGRPSNAVTLSAALLYWPHLLAAAVAALAVTFLFYSSFFTHPAGLIDWFRSFPIYGARGLEGGAHQQGWSYYLGLLAFRRSGGVIWTEGLILALAAVGGVFAVARRRANEFWPRYITFYALLTAAVFSLLSYKTPWNILPFYVGFTALAGYGAACLAALPHRRVARAAVVAALAAAAAQLGVQDWRANFRYPADPRNPYVYAHTTPDFLRLVERVRDVAAVRPERGATLVKVIAGPYEQWPLPWYLRRMTRVGYWSRAGEAGILDGAPLLVSSEENSAAVSAALGDRYVSELYGLRPDVLLTLYIERGLWERFIETRGGRN